MERTVAVDDEPRIAGEDERCIHEAGEAARHLSGPDVPSDMPQAILSPKTKRTEPARYVGARMIASEDGTTSALRIHDGEWLRLIAGNPRFDGWRLSLHSVALPGARRLASPGCRQT